MEVDDAETTGAVSGTERVVDGITVASAGGLVIKTVVGSKLAAEEMDGGVGVLDTTAKSLDGRWLGREAILVKKLETGTIGATTDIWLWMEASLGAEQ